MTRLIRAVACMLAAAVVATPHPAVAHAELEASDPRDGVTLKELPERVTLELNEPVKEPAFVVVLDETGKRINSKAVAVSGRKVTSSIPNRAGDGRFTMSYRIVSADGHAVSGSLKFTVKPVVGSTSPTAASPAPSPEPTSMAGDNVSKDARESRSNTAAIIFILLALVAITGLSILIIVRLAGRVGGD